MGAGAHGSSAAALARGLATRRARAGADRGRQRGGLHRTFSQIHEQAGEESEGPRGERSRCGLLGVVFCSKQERGGIECHWPLLTRGHGGDRRRARRGHRLAFAAWELRRYRFGELRTRRARNKCCYHGRYLASINGGKIRSRCQ